VSKRDEPLGTTGFAPPVHPSVPHTHWTKASGEPSVTCRRDFPADNYLATDHLTLIDGILTVERNYL
jgi:hypothetical protein